MIKIHVLDGGNSIGGNKIMIEDMVKGAALLLDFGKNFGAENQYFDDFLPPRASKGIQDLVSLGLLPRLPNLYREDLIIDDLCRVQPYTMQTPIAAALVSHAHMDHIGYIPYLDTDIPVLCSAESAAIMKAMQDTTSGLAAELTYAEIRERSIQNGHEILTARSSKTRVFRPYVILGSVSSQPAFSEIWLAVQKKRDNKQTDQKLPEFYEGSTVEVAGFRIKYWTVDHSIPGAMSFAVETSEGWVVYTGDLRLHGGRGSATRSFFKEAAKLNPRVLISEGTHPTTRQPTTEQQVYDRALDAVSVSHGLVIADFGPRNVERLLSFLQIAREVGRILVITSKDYIILRYLHAVNAEMPDPAADPHVMVYVGPKTNLSTWEANVLDQLPSEKKVLPLHVRADPRQYMLCFSYYDFLNLLDIDVHGGTYIYSSSEAFNEEMRLDHEKMLNWVRFFDFEVKGRIGPLSGPEVDPFHASGHIHADGIREMVETMKPQFVVPIHTESPEFFEQFQSQCKVIYPSSQNPITI